MRRFTFLWTLVLLGLFATGFAQAQTTVTLTVVPNPVVLGSQVTITVTVTKVGANTPTGQVLVGDEAIFILGPAPLSNGTVQFLWTPPTLGTHNLNAHYSGDANYSAGQSSIVPLVVVPNSTTSTLTSNAPGNTINYGLPVTLTATVTSSAPGAIGGSGSYYDGATLLASGVPVTSGSSSLNLPAPTLSAGVHSLTFVYSGGGVYGGSTSAPYLLTVNGVTANITLVSNNNPSQSGASVTFTATVSGSSGTPTGTVTFFDGATNIGSNALSSGTASLSTSGLSVGSHNITAQYGGNSGYNPATSNTVVQVVNSAVTTPTVSLSSNNNPSQSGASVTFTATVSGSSGTPTGTVTFFDGATSLGSNALSSGSASLSTSGLSVGSHNITAQYGGNGSYNSATSNTVVQVVNSASLNPPSFSVLSSSAGTSFTFGTATTLSVSLTPSSPPGGYTQQVQFYDGANLLGSGAVNGSGVASLSGVLLQGGTHSLTARYPGDSNFASGTSAALVVTVNAASASVNLVSSSNPSSLGSSVTFTATVSSGAGTPTGTVDFFDGAAKLNGSAVVLSGGVAAFATSSLTAGTHSIRATYNGSGSFSTANSNTISQVVNSAIGTATLVNFTITYDTTVNNAPVFGQPITFSIDIQGSNGTPTGNVVLTDNGSPISSPIAIVGGKASITTAQGNAGALLAGNHNFGFNYQGDASFSPASSGQIALTIKPAPTKTVLNALPSGPGVGQSITLTAQVCPIQIIPAGTTCISAFAPGLSGSVTFRDGSSVLGTSGVVDSNGIATITVNLTSPPFASPAVGSHSITATYNGAGASPSSDPNYATSTASAGSFTASRTATETTITSTNANGQVVLTVTVRPLVSGTGTPTGTVQFLNGTTVLGTVNLTSGPGGTFIATLTLPSLPAGTITGAYSGDANFAPSTSKALGQGGFGAPLTIVNAASYLSGSYAPESLATIFSKDLTTSTVVANVSPWPTTLGGLTVDITDSLGVTRPANVYFVSKDQMSFLFPANTALGNTQVTVRHTNGNSATVAITMRSVAPGIFASNLDGTGVAAANLVRVKPDNSQVFEDVAVFDASQNKFIPVPVDMSNTSDRLYLAMYGTGFRLNTSTTATVNGTSIPVLFAGKQPQYFGLDQVNIGPLPPSVRGGVVNIVITSDGQVANTVTITTK